MTKTCPSTTKFQCTWLSRGGVGIALFFAVYTIIAHAMAMTHTREFVLSLAVCFVMFACVWVVRVLGNIMIWWKDLQTSVNNAAKLLEETKQDIKEIKSMDHHELPSR